ncbi:transcription initiation factor TFIID subunit 13 [Thecamonas trahens ATCC 50062]|uniref:Transcription initiation factor TFIID subunit 13 n=1 Tax=Thecamonas trahens ATCC 50062 TaxID=461836 RepID=A0A0L0DL55_THETB|nr:transcription initiation factor TFIID subunit 13 [Thecamonas trahens ATCC 50062]KNC52108.1 transcription initiation factor TFIID subunit 13 [Thecamonas trahens ATCC 50062]|eukprot:XP_013762112.1 transcription initiation factor TFIID subunit 13 [Thecamonas trahens ATCC 50062]
MNGVSEEVPPPQAGSEQAGLGATRELAGPAAADEQHAAVGQEAEVQPMVTEEAQESPAAEADKTGGEGEAVEVQAEGGSRKRARDDGGEGEDEVDDERLAKERLACLAYLDEQRRALEADIRGRTAAEVVVDGELKPHSLFTSMLEEMVFGFGDVSQPLSATVNAVEDIVVDYIRSMTLAALQVAERRGKLMAEDFLFLIRNDDKKYERVRELLNMREVIKRERANFEQEKTMLEPATKRRKR